MNAKATVMSQVTGDRNAMVLITFLLGALILFVGNVTYNGISADRDARYLELAGDLRVLSQQIYNR